MIGIIGFDRIYVIVLEYLPSKNKIIDGLGKRLILSGLGLLVEAETKIRVFLVVTVTCLCYYCHPLVFSRG